MSQSRSPGEGVLDPTSSASWAALSQLAERPTMPTRDLFAAEPDRLDRMCLCPFDDMVVDFSRQRIDMLAWSTLLEFARDRDISAAAEEMFAGATLNTTEGRAALHVALRAGVNESFELNGEDVAATARTERLRVETFVQAVLAGERQTHDGERFTHVVNVGIGGSDLGPRLVVDALRHVAPEGLEVRFVANVDGAELERALVGLDPRRTLVCVVSKTFTTQETMTNAASIRRWLVAGHGGDASCIAAHMVAVTSAPARAEVMGISAEQTFAIWDWVGGRYSLWSSVGISVALGLGMEAFEALLAGAREMDAHFQHAPLERNVPVMMALVGVWNTNFLGAESLAVLPYDARLQLLPAYLQQADMESNGKSVRLDGSAVRGHHTGPIVWGSAGTNGQHAFHQLLHQGTRAVAADVLVAACADHSHLGHHDQLVANALAQTQALMVGRDLETARARGTAEGADPTLAPHRVFEGDRPTTTVLYGRLTPRTLGRLLALYEHKIYVQGRIWGINSFDQWGVELGKELARGLVEAVNCGEIPEGTDPSTRALLAHLVRLRAQA